MLHVEVEMIFNVLNKDEQNERDVPGDTYPTICIWYWRDFI